MYGDPARGDLWQALDDVLFQKFNHASGISLYVACTCVDSGGHHTQGVYYYCKKRQLRRVFAIKGSSVTGKPLVSRPSRNNKLRVKLFMVGVDTAKEMVYSRLKIEEPGAGYCHFPVGRDEEYFKQLTAEKVFTRYVRGFPKRVWEKPAGRRNEALDCRVYALTALHILNPNLERIAARLETKQPEEEEKQQATPPAPTTQARRPPKKRRRGTGFVGAYKT